MTARPRRGRTGRAADALNPSGVAPLLRYKSRPRWGCEKRSGTRLFVPAEQTTELESSVNPQAGKPALHQSAGTEDSPVLLKRLRLAEQPGDPRQ